MRTKFTALIIAILGVTLNIYSQTQFYDVLPDVTSCQEGTLKDSEKQKILNLVNQIRSIHGLKPVTYNYTKDKYVQKSALLSAANEQLSHTPPTNWKCFSADGSTGSQNSNLHIQWFYGSSWPACETGVYGWMIDQNVDVCGHRRWIIDPFLKFIAFGRVDGKSVQNAQFNVTGMSIYVIDNDKQNISDWQSDFVAYPYQNYPTNLVFTSSNQNWFFSFTAIFDKSNYWNNQKVNYTNATIEIKNESNQTIATSEVSANNEGYGVPNLLKWKIPTVQKEVKYTVNIKNVDLNGTKKNYTYWFKITDQTGNTPGTPTLLLPANAAKNVDVNQQFTWNAATDADSYSIQIAKDNAFANIVTEQSDITNTNFTASALPENTLLYWRVSGSNNIGKGSWSEVRSFTTKSLPPQKPVLSEPNDTQTSVSLTPDLKWQAITGATTYNVQLCDDNKFNTLTLIINQENIPKNSYTIPNSTLKYDTQYYWRVRAKNVNGYSEFSDSRSFKTIDMTSVDVEASETLNIFPNPAIDKILCKMNIISEKAHILLVNEQGIVIANYTIEGSGEKFLDINLNQLSSGSYNIRMTDGQNIISRRIIINK